MESVPLVNCGRRYEISAARRAFDQNQLAVQTQSLMATQGIIAELADASVAWLSPETERKMDYHRLGEVIEGLQAIQKAYMNALNKLDREYGLPGYQLGFITESPTGSLKEAD